MKRVTCSVYLMVCLGLADVRGADWPQFLGPNRDGKSAETGLANSWPAGGPREVWRKAGGAGMSGFSIVDGQALTLVQRDGSQYLISVDAKSGEQKWQSKLAPQYRNQMGNGPRATPTVADGSAYAFTGDGVLAAVSVKDGSVIWRKEAVRDHGAKVADYGMSCSPLVVGENVLVTIGAPRATVVAYDRKSGDVAWTAGTGAPAGYSSPALRKVAGKQQVVLISGSAAMGLAPETGDLLWRHRYVTDYDCNIATPLAVDDNVFISAGENHGSVLLQLKPTGTGFSTSTVWASNGGGAVLRNEWQTSIQLGDHFFGLDNVGSAGPVTHLACVNAKTGEPVWREARFGKSNLIYADGKLFMTTMKGEIVLVAANTDGFKELGRAKVMGMTRQAPALSNGLLYVRDDKELICFDVRGSE